MSKKTYKRYSLAFKRKIVREIEAGALTISEARRRYSIGGSSTIQRWLGQYGTEDHQAKKITVSMPEEVDRVKALEEEKQALESALAKAHLKILTLESTLEAASEHYGEDVKKSFVTKASTTPSGSAKQRQK